MSATEEEQSYLKRYCSHRFPLYTFPHQNMAPTIALLAAALTLFSSALAFSPDQCNVTSYGAPARAACSTLLTNIAALGKGNTPYLFIPANFPTPAGLNATRREFPQTWTTSKFPFAPLHIPGQIEMQQ